MPRKVILPDKAARLLLVVQDNPGITTATIIKKLKSRRPSTIYQYLVSLNDRKLFLVVEKHGGSSRDGRPSFAYTLSEKGLRRAELYRKLFELENSK